LLRIAAALAIAALVIAVWLFLGEQISRAADHVYAHKPTPKPSAPLALNRGTFVLGDRSWPLPITPVLDSQARVTIQSFTLGPIQKRWADSMEFIAEPTDQISFSRTNGRLPWPTPFYGLFTLGASAPKWSRNAYDKLRWTKANGAVLEIVWRDEQRLRPGGWSDEYNNQLSSLTIHPSPFENIAIAYLAKTKHWEPSEYRLEPRPSENSDELFSAIYLKDENASHPGAGHSVLLRINRSSKMIVNETAWQ
jgi:hypothetical protein